MEVSQKYFLCNFLNADKQKELFESFFVDGKGYELSKKAREDMGLQKNRSYTYGEITFEGFKEILDIVSPTSEFEFLDLGSGVGKALIASSLLYPSSKLIGYENLPSLVVQSNTIVKNYLSMIKDEYSDVFAPEFSIVQDSFFHADFSTADVIYACSTCFEQSYIEFISSKIDELKLGAYLIVLTKQISHDSLECVFKGQKLFNWGSPTVYIYKKV